MNLIIYFQVIQAQTSLKKSKKKAVKKPQRQIQKPFSKIQKPVKSQDQEISLQIPG